MSLLRPISFVIFYLSYMPSPLPYCNNVSDVYLSSNTVQHQRIKHVEMDIHFVQEKVALGHVKVLHVPCQFQFADIFTKGLSQPLFLDFRASLCVHPPPTSTEGCDKGYLLNNILGRFLL